jgi:hypothetical protein
VQPVATTDVNRQGKAYGNWLREPEDQTDCEWLLLRPLAGDANKVMKLQKWGEAGRRDRHKPTPLAIRTANQRDY